MKTIYSVTTTGIKLGATCSADERRIAWPGRWSNAVRKIGLAVWVTQRGISPITTEEALGISLLPVLRALYAQVANGGFGPAYGITGACGGYSVGDAGRYHTIDMCTDTDPHVHYLDVREYEQEHGNPTYFELRETIQPSHFLHLCYEGCVNDYYIDGNSGRIYLRACCGSLPDSMVPNQVLPGALRPESIIGYQRVADSLEDWLKRWLRRAAIRFEVEQKRHLQ